MAKRIIAPSPRKAKVPDEKKPSPKSAIIPRVPPLRNFSIIAHVDHGKSTLADALMRRCGAVAPRETRQQLLDSMDLERERGITIKSQTALLQHRAPDGQTCALNLLDTPGHVDFSYEVSRSLSACEGALLLVDAAQGVQAQTIAACNTAADLGLEIIPALSKTDLPAADPERVRSEIEDMTGIAAHDAVPVSAKTGHGVDDILNAVVQRIPPPSGNPNAPLRALVIDSWFDKYLGVVVLVRVVDGKLNRRDRALFMASGETGDCDPVGVFTPKAEPRETLSAGEVGYVSAGLKDLASARVGDTLTLASAPAKTPLPGFQQAKPHVFASLFPPTSADFDRLRTAAEKLRLNDAAFSFETEKSPALGFGLRCGFLGLLHMEIVQERLEREHGAKVVVASPGVACEVETTDGQTRIVDHPARLPDPTRIREIREPVAAATIVVPAERVGAVMTLAANRRAAQTKMEVAGRQALLRYDIPFAELVSGFFDKLKSATRGFASLDYEFKEHRAADIVRLDILINGDAVDALAVMVPRSDAAARGRELAARIRELIPRQMFEVAVQAAVNGKIVARETVRAARKNVLAKCYGGDVTRKRKLLEKQKAGKKRMKRFGRVEIPQEAFLAALARAD